MIPIYEQIVDQIKTLIRKGELKENDNLPSVRALARELKISALTVKKAYDDLEAEGFTVTVQYTTFQVTYKTFQVTYKTFQVTYKTFQVTYNYFPGYL